MLHFDDVVVVEHGIAEDRGVVRKGRDRRDCWIAFRMREDAVQPVAGYFRIGVHEDHVLIREAA